MTKSLDLELVGSVQSFYQRYPQLGTSEVTWVNSLEWKGRTVLDAGCGDGSILQAIHMRHRLRQGIGLDTSTDALKIAAQCKMPELRWVNGSIFDIPLRNAEVDDVLSIGVLHYFKDAAPAIKEYARMVKPGGRVILFVYRPHIVHVIRQWLGRRYERKFTSRLKAVNSEVERNLIMNTVAPPAYWPLSRTKLNQLANLNGLEVDRIIDKTTHVPQLILRGPEGTEPGILRRQLAALMEILVKIDPLHFWSFGYYVVYRRKQGP